MTAGSWPGSRGGSADAAGHCYIMVDWGSDDGACVHVRGGAYPTGDAHARAGAPTMGLNKKNHEVELG